MSQNLNDLFSGAASRGLIGGDAHGVLTGSLGPVVVAGAAGASLEDIETSDVTLITVLIDESSSIRARGLDQAVRDGHGALVQALAQSSEADSVLLALWLFHSDRRVVHSYVPLDQAVSLDGQRYRPRGATSLYDTWCEALAANVAYAQQLRDGGTPCRSVVVVVTDGEDTQSRRRPKDCATLSRDLLASELFVLAFVGVGDDVDFHGVARSMGVPKENVLVQAQATAQGMRSVFQVVSQSAIRSSRRRVGGGNFFGP